MKSAKTPSAYFAPGEHTGGSPSPTHGQRAHPLQNHTACETTATPNTNPRCIHRGRNGVLVWTGLLLLSLLAPTAQAATASDLLDASGVTGGLVVHVGCGEGKLTAGLRANEAYVVHGLDADAAHIAAARKHVKSLGLASKVAFDTFDGRNLPYVDGMVNLVVVERPDTVAPAEIMRVLAPGGVAMVGGRKTVKPRPAEIDEWTHYLHGADNNAVAADTVVAPPRRLQWQARPKWTRHHDKMSSLSAMVSTGGRIFYFMDEGSTASIYMPPKWALIARDAFNGKLLWRRKIARWYNTFKGLKDGPADAPRRLVAAEGKVYATLSLEGLVTCMDAVTGETLGEYRATKGAEEIILSDGTLFVLVGPRSIGDGKRLDRPTEKRRIVALNAATGRELWEASDVVAALTMAVDARGVYYFNFASKHAVALDRKTGQKLWTSANALPTPAAQKSFFASKLVVADGVVLLASGEYSGMIKSTGGANKPDTLTAMSAATGKTLWVGKHPPSGYSSPENVFVIEGIVWCDASSSGGLTGGLTGFDLKTGEVKHNFPSDKTSYWFHHRCHPGRATSNYVITSRTGSEFIDFRKKTWDLNHWTRGACLYGLMPCNGLLYTPPAPCACYAETYLHSFNALAPAKSSPTPDAGPQLTKGAAFGKVNPKSEIRNPQSNWPTYRGSNARSGVTKTPVPAKLREGWKTDLGGKLSAVTVADGMLFVAAVDEHTVHALDVRSGKPRWRFTAGGRVDSPPTFFAGMVLFGSADGRVYCLRASDGELVWRFRAARGDRRILVYEQIESLWPVHGSILVRDGMAHFVAGRSAFVDGGMRLYRLNAKTGAVVSQTVLNEKNPATGENIQDTVKWLNMAVGRPDVLSSDDKHIYMRSQAFDLKGKRLAVGPTLKGPAEGTQQGGERTHLFCPTGFLDDNWFHRSYWMYGKTWSSGWNGYYIAGKHAPAGRMICVGDDTVYVFGRLPQQYRWTTPLEYRLFASSKEWKAAPRKVGATPAPKPPAKKKGAKKRSRPPEGPLPVTNKANYSWSTDVPILVRAMALAGTSSQKTLFIAGPRDLLDETALGKQSAGKNPLIAKQHAALQGRAGAILWAVSATTGEKLAQYALDAPPVFDSLAAANGCLYLTTTDGKVLCLTGAK